MSGMVGILSSNSLKENSTFLRRMLASIRHEQWYSEGQHTFDEGHVSVGWVSHDDNQDDIRCCKNEAGDVALFCMGGTVRGHGVSEDPASCIIRLYEKKGEGFVGDLNGCFCGIVVDQRQRKTVVFNDRFGVKRIFMCELKGSVYFSSEAKALLAMSSDLRQFDPVGVSELLTCGCTIGDRSLYKGVEVLPPASICVVERGSILKKARYFDAKEWRSEDKLEEKEFLLQIPEMMERLVRECTKSYQQVGVSLTGGLDSRIIAACLNDKHAQVCCYTFGSMYRDTFDVRVAREVSRASGFPHSVITLGQAFLESFPKYLDRAVYISDGYLGVSGAAELYLNAQARAIAPIRVTGNYGGELLRGDRAFKHHAFRNSFISHDLRSHLKETELAFGRFEDVDPLTFALFRQVPYMGYGRMAIEQSQVITRTPFLDNDLAKLVYSAPSRLLKGPKVSAHIISRYNPVLLSIPTDRGLFSGERFVGYPWMTSYREALFKAEYWSSHGMPGWLSRISSLGLSKVLQNTFLGRHKFQHYLVWSRTSLSSYIRETLSSGLRGVEHLFNRKSAMYMVDEHISGRNNYLDEIDKLLTLCSASQTLLRCDD